MLEASVPEHVRPPSERLVLLLSEARRQLVEDPLSADRVLARAVEMLRTSSSAVVSHGAAEAGGLAPWQVLRTKAVVDARLAERLTIADLAAAVRLSTSHFTRAFGRSFGSSPHTYLMARRITRAKQLMLESRSPLSEIALDCGLSDQAHLSRAFRRFEGVTPNSWRRRYTHLGVDYERAPEVIS